MRLLTVCAQILVAAGCGAFVPIGGIIPEPATVPHVAVDGAGNGVVVWNAGALHASTYDGNIGEWTADEVLALASDERAAVAMFGSGSAVVAVEGTDRIQTLGFHFQGGWDAEPTLLGNGPFPPREPCLGSNLYGRSANAFAVWREVVQLGPLRQFAAGFGSMHPPGGDWRLPGRLDTNPTQTGADPQNVFNVRVAVGGDGTAIAVWEQIVESGDVASLAARYAGGWQTPFLLGGSVDGGGMPDVGMDAEGNAVAVFRQAGGLFARRFDAAAQEWSPPQQVDGAAADGVAFPRVAVNGDGAAVAVWAGQTAGRVYAAVSSADGAWAPAVGLGDGGGGFVTHQRAAIDAQGRARVMWEQFGRVLTAEYDGEMWQPREDLGLGDHPDLAMAPGGRAIGVWWNDGLERRVWEPEAPPPPADEGLIVFASDRFDGNWEIYTMKPDGTEVVRRTFNDAADTDPVWSPSGDRFCFVSDRNAGAPGNTDLYVRDVEAGTVTRLTFFGADFGFARDPAWSPDGTEIAFAGEIGGNGIHVVSLERGGSRTLSGGRTDRWPMWRPDGTQIAYSDGIDVRLLDPTLDATQMPGLLVDRIEVDQAPAWAPDDRTVAFVSLGIQLFGTEQETLRQVPNTQDGDRGPAWSPVRRTDLLLVRDTAEGARIFFVEAVSGSATEIPDQIGNNEDPDWTLVQAVPQ